MTVLLNLAGSLALFLYGMKVMSDGLMEIAGGGLREVMARLTSNRIKALFTGVMITSLIQSSSATTVMVVSFVNAGLLGLTAGIAVIMGANIGTTFTAWLIALLGFKVSMTAIALPLLAVGFVLILRNEPRLRKFGNFLVGFCLLFIGLEFMKESVPNLQDNPAIFDFISRFAEPGLMSTLIFLAIGTVLTVVLQSSSATMAITIVAASEGWLPFEAAAAIILGENIGTTITANVAAFVANANARRAALAHLIVNLIGVVWAIALIPYLIAVVDRLAVILEGASPMLDPLAVPLGLALFHSLFNILNASLLIGFVNSLSRFVVGIVPERITPEMELTRPQFLSTSAMRYPETALAALESESRRLFENAIFEVVAHGMSVHRSQIRSGLSAEDVVRASRDLISINPVDFFSERIAPLYDAMGAFAGEIQEKHSLSPAQSQRLLELRHANRGLLDVVKNVAVLNRLLEGPMGERNEAFRDEIDAIRAVLVRLVRHVFALSREQDLSAREADFTSLEEAAYRFDEDIFSEVDELIREKRITPGMGSSLIDASGVNKQLTKDLLKTARRLYAEMPDDTPAPESDIEEVGREALAGDRPEPA